MKRNETESGEKRKKRPTFGSNMPMRTFADEDSGNSNQSLGEEDMKNQNRTKLHALQAILTLILVTVLIAACGGQPAPQATQAPQEEQPAQTEVQPAETEAQPEETEAPAAETEAPAQTEEAPAATTAPEGEVQGSGEVSLWTEFTAGGEATGIDELVNTWNGMNNGITINHRPIGNEEFFTVVRTGLAGGEPPDILQYEGYQQTRDFAGAGQLTDLTELWEANKDRFDLADAGEAACTFEGKVYCVPYSFVTGWQIYYNPDLLAQHNIEVPTTMEEFLAAAQTLKDAGVTPIALGNKDGWPGEHWWMGFLVQRCGVDTVYQAMRNEGASFTDACFVQAATDFQNLQTQGYLSAGAASDDYGTAQAVFLSGQAAFFQTGAWFASGWEQDPPPFEVGVMPFPRFSDAANQEDVFGAITHVFGIPSNARNKEAAITVLEWLISDEGGNIWAKNGNASVVSGAVENSAPDIVQELYVNARAADKSLPWVENEMPPGVGEDKVYNGTVALLTGDMTPEEFGQSIQEALEAAE
jgi:raffinose/stachyose/melibiose transport system substrate-binding protein